MTATASSESDTSNGYGETWPSLQGEVFTMSAESGKSDETSKGTIGPTNLVAAERIETRAIYLSSIKINPPEEQLESRSYLYKQVDYNTKYSLTKVNQVLLLHQNAHLQKRRILNGK